jgi:hypothetical protein
MSLAHDIMKAIVSECFPHDFGASREENKDKMAAVIESYLAAAGSGEYETGYQRGYSDGRDDAMCNAACCTNTIE